MAIFLVHGSAHAEEKGDRHNFRIWLNPGVYSYHFDQSKDLREVSGGFGAEVLLLEDHALMGGAFTNSNDKRSNYVAYQWRPLHWSPLGVAVHAGFAVGAFDGYPNYRNGGWFPAILPMIAVEGRVLGVNLFVVPTISDWS